MNKFVSTAAALCVSGCASYYNPMVRAEKPGAIIAAAATVIDTSKREGGTRAQLFYISKVDGKEIVNALNATSKFNYGKGMAVQPITPKRAVPGNMMLTLEICAETYNGAPILDLFRTDQKKCEVLSRSFEPNKTYYVTGRIEGNAATVEIVNELPVNSGESSIIWDGKY